jgi:DNA repair exonuclease SbcCD ATPase subunit
MIRFQSLTLRNFMSYGNNTTVIGFDTAGTTLIVGEDLDNTSNGQGGNGVGKTTLMNALVYALYDRPISDIKVDDLINNVNKRHLEVTVNFEKNGISYQITRIRKGGKTGRENTVYLTVNGKDSTLDSVNNTNKEIERIVGMPYDLFIRVVVVSATHKPFLDMPVTSHYQANQTDFVERLFDLTILSEKADALKDMIKAVEETLKVEKIKIEHLEKEHMRHNESVQDAKTRVTDWHKTNKKTIQALKDKLKKIVDVDFDKERALHDEIAAIDKKTVELQAKQKKLADSIKNYKQVVEHMTNDLEHLHDAKCPYCLQKYTNADVKITESETSLTESQSKLVESSTQKKLIDTELSKLLEEKIQLKRQMTVQDLEELITIKNESSTLEQRIIELTSAPNPLLGMLDDLEKIEIPAIDYTIINEMKKLKDHQDFLLKLLTKKDSFVRKALLNKNLPFLNTRLEHALTQLGLTHRVEFTHEMTAEISQFTRPMGFGNLSNGQRARVNLALAFAFRDVLQSLHEPVNICLLDEVLDVGLDDVGVTMAARMLKRKARDESLCMFVISHRDALDSVFDRTMVIQMEKGFSSIREEISN